ncbi:MAG TPA: VC0807 family protein [Stackebrandtia sp.]|jgi:hypothetical protein|uniref:VC0807 family protein n=1 Tax=Stackebrandtia sp. TaxID=2023065 RepID=UPI002D545B07|nr:VC0807 family protein [Stackebrandtia sp.]HZE41653.1 VC0807 family protein [Stackebrandtia sp.]
MTTDVTTAPKAPASAGSASRSAMIKSLLLDLVVPMGVFYGLRAVGVGQWWALLASAIVPIVVIVQRFIARRQIEFFALFVIMLMAAGLALSALTGNPRIMLIREAWVGMLGGLVGVWLIASIFYGRPALMVLFRSFVIAKVGSEGLAAWEARWDAEADFRLGVRVLTAAWGVAGILNAVVNVIFAYTVPLDAAPLAMGLIWPCILAPLLVFQIIYTKRKNLRA